MPKLCKTCGEEKAETEFHRDRSKADGLNAYCKACHIAKQRDYQSRPPRRVDPPGLKTCSHCKVVRPLDEYFADTKRSDGLDRQCKTCRAERHSAWRLKNLDKAARDQKAYRQANREKFADYGRKKSYGMAPGEYDKMLEAQGGRCAICRTDSPRGKGNVFHVDHCHDHEHVRGLLCMACNIGIGQFRNDESILLAAAAYVRATKSPPAG